MPEYIKVPLSELSKFTRVPPEASPIPRPREGEGTPLETARDIMGSDHFFGPEALHTALGIDVPETDLPPIPFTHQELQEAKERGEYLILRADKTRDGAPLTMQTMAERVEPVLTANNQGKALRNVDGYSTELFYTTETPRAGWTLVAKESLPNTTSKDYIEQTHAIIEHLKTTVFNNQPLPPDYQKAVDEFDQYLHTTFPNKTPEEIHTELAGENWQKYSEDCANLSITQLARETASEAFFDTMLLRVTTKSDMLLPNRWTWTSSRSLDGALVDVGLADANGAFVNRWRPGDRLEYLGVLLSRRGSGS